MLELLGYLLKQGVATSRDNFPDLPEHVRGLPIVTDKDCAEACNLCADLCPTQAIDLSEANSPKLDLGKCIACGLCTDACPSGTLVNDRRTRTARASREALISTRENPAKTAATKETKPSKPGLFQRSLAVRVVSTGCSACDMEIGASLNPIFDMERFGVTVVASPRYADALVVTGPVPLGMRAALLSCYEAMSSPKLVVALGTCAISGGLHGGGYSQAEGVDKILPVDIYIPGCPPHPWSIIDGMLAAKSLKT
ncbi:MAG: NADH-quinone oxidoreductase subunit NuoB [Candidatus Obscuribacter phosphatis]|uniref:NADH-quinone oxidoreductase subunit NuoB n=1 Tax=Candidatus Obscuribacter phosphatis TaxID=1906157 RepID=A0A8J7P7L6_9BACT|nr:NADH-quinone oxidoreductase subunit NuoB [Candidatus Obscuribacter phosphatis]